MTNENAMYDIPDVSDVEEQPQLGNGAQVLQIQDTKPKDDTNGYPMLQIQLVSVDNPDCEPVFHFLSIPTAGDPKLGDKKRFYKRFCVAFGIELSGQLDPAELIGKSSRLMVKSKDGRKNVDIPRMDA